MTFNPAILGLAISMFLTAATGAAQPIDLPLVVESNIQETYVAGTEHEISVSIRLMDPDGSVERGVWFLNVVENNAAENYPQAAHRIFGSASESVPIFRVPFEGGRLREGLSSTVTIRFRRDAPEGSYSLVFQLFEGEETNPNRVQIEQRRAIESFVFEVVR